MSFTAAFILLARWNILAFLVAIMAPFGMLRAAMSTPSVTHEKFGEFAGKPVTIYHLDGGASLQVDLMDYGATLVRILAPDRKGHVADVALGFDTFDGYLNPKNPYFGATIGRYANRLAKGQFTLDGKTYQAPVNNGPNSLHGGIHGFDKQMWDGEVLSQDPPTVRFSRISPDGEEGYPGNLRVSVTFTLTPRHEIKIEDVATTDQDTVVNLTNHSYFNLAGAGEGTVREHQVRIAAEAYLPVDANQIPTGEMKKVEGTPFDLRKLTPIGAHLMETGGSPIGYDHCYLPDGKGMRRVAGVLDPASGRTLSVSTDQPGLQFYTGNFLDGTVVGKGGKAYPQYGAFCFETQHFPDSPNQPSFPSTVLKPGETYRHVTIYAFGTDLPD